MLDSQTTIIDYQYEQQNNKQQLNLNKQQSCCQLIDFFKNKQWHTTHNALHIRQMLVDGEDATICRHFRLW